MTEVITHFGPPRTVRAHAQDSGSAGRPVMLVHGWPLSGESWSEQVGPPQAAGYCTVAYDRRGFGRSDKPHGGYEYGTLADDLKAALTELDLRDVILVGFSMGGGEVARSPGKHGADRVRSVVLSAAVPPYPAKTAADPGGPLDQATADEMETGLTRRDRVFDQCARPDVHDARRPGRHGGCRC